MARRCEICGKGHQIGYLISHAHNKTKHVWYPNLKKIRVGEKGSRRRIKVCTKCLRSKVLNQPALKV